MPSTAIYPATRASTSADAILFLMASLAVLVMLVCIISSDFFVDCEFAIPVATLPSWTLLFLTCSFHCEANVPNFTFFAAPPLDEPLRSNNYG